MGFDQCTPKHEITRQVIEVLREGIRFRATFLDFESASETNGYTDRLSIEYEVSERCQHPVNDIRMIEPITILITEDTIPIVMLDRADFPAVPHLNLYNNRVIRTICYSEVPFEELRHKMNGRFLLECINNWFVMTARGELHRPDQPLEPFFPGVDNSLIINIERLPQLFCRFKKVEKSGSITLIQDDDNGTCDSFAFLKLPVYPKTSGLINVLPETLGQLLTSFNEKDMMIKFIEWLKSLFLIMRTPEYNARFGQIKSAIMSCKCIFMLPIPLVRFSAGGMESLDTHAFVTVESLDKIIKDFGLVANHSKLDQGKTMNNMGCSIRLTPYNVHYDISPKMARIYNGLQADIDRKICIIGVGALGSQIANNCVHAGFGQWTLVDKDILWPHNIARHTLTRDSIGCFKANEMSGLLNKITVGNATTAICEDALVASDILNDTFLQSDLIVDASASPAMERYLAIDAKSDARKVSFFMNPTGTATVMLLEDAEASIRLDMLEMQYISELLHDENLKGHLSIPDTLLYSGTCRSITSRLSQDSIALSAAICSRALKKYTALNDGRIVIWNHDDDTVLAIQKVVNDWVEFIINGWKVYLYKPLQQAIGTQRTSSLPNETGGVLIGAFDLSRKYLYIVDQIEAPNDSISSPTSFIRGCKGLEERLKDIGRVVFDNLYYIGEWHSHPNATTQMSGDDKILMSAITEYNRERCRPACMIIAGSSTQSIYVDE